MLRFRKKLLISCTFLLFLLIGCLYPFVETKLLLFCATLLTLYSLITWIIGHRVSLPIQKIIAAIRPYQQGKEDYLPRLDFTEAISGDEFGQLAFTLNSLSERIQKQIENLLQQRRETEGILESLEEGVLAVDTSGKVIFANQAACRMLQRSHETLIGSFLDANASSEQELMKKSQELIVEVLQTSEPTSQPWAFGGKNPRYLDLKASPLARQNGVILVLQDKTSDHKMIAMGKDFIANASHELRTPITIIRGFAETLQDIPNLSPEMLHDITDKIVRTCGRLDKLVKSLLALADAENFSDRKLAACDLVSLAENSQYLLLSAHPHVEIALKGELSSALVLGDPDLLDLALMNLLENGVKYSQNAPKITIFLQKENGVITLQVQDCGIGIPETDLPHIFDRFYTVDKARSRKSGGAGLGLSIVKTVVEKHQGTITVVSELGKGTLFTLKFPLLQP